MNLLSKNEVELYLKVLVNSVSRSSKEDLDNIICNMADVICTEAKNIKTTSEVRVIMKKMFQKKKKKQ